VHGANRLASNSLLEGLVFGARAAVSMREVSGRDTKSSIPELRSPVPVTDALHLLHNLQQQMWQNAGLLRDADGLRAMKHSLDQMRPAIAPALDRASLELANLHAVARLIVISALAREESRGAHYRNDFPRRDDAHFACHSVVRRDEVSFEPMAMSALAR